MTSGQISLTANYSSNLAPVVTGPGNQNANEGSSTSFNLGSFTDAAADTPWAVSVDWGDGSTDTTLNATTAGSLGTASHTYLDGPATHTVTVTVTDKNGASGQAAFSVSVANVKPTVTIISGATTVNEGDVRTYTYTVSDPGNDTVTVVESCGANGTRTDTRRRQQLRLHLLRRSGQFRRPGHRQR